MERRTKKTERRTQSEDTETLTEMARDGEGQGGDRELDRVPGAQAGPPGDSWPRSASVQLEVEAAPTEAQHLNREDARGVSGGGGRGFRPGPAALGPRAASRASTASPRAETWRAASCKRLSRRSAHSGRIFSLAWRRRTRFSGGGAVGLDKPGKGDCSEKGRWGHMGSTGCSWSNRSWERTTLGSPGER